MGTRMSWRKTFPVLDQRELTLFRGLLLEKQVATFWSLSSLFSPRIAHLVTWEALIACRDAQWGWHIWPNRERLSGRCGNRLGNDRFRMGLLATSNCRDCVVSLPLSISISYNVWLFQSLRRLPQEQRTLISFYGHNRALRPLYIVES